MKQYKAVIENRAYYFNEKSIKDVMMKLEEMVAKNFISKSKINKIESIEEIK